MPCNLSADGPRLPQAWQAAAAVQHSGADLERGIAFLLEGALDTQAAAHRFLVAAGDELPDIDVSGPLQQACFPCPLAASRSAGQVEAHARVHALRHAIASMSPVALSCDCCTRKLWFRLEQVEGICVCSPFDTSTTFVCQSLQPFALPDKPLQVV